MIHQNTDQLIARMQERHQHDTRENVRPPRATAPARAPERVVVRSAPAPVSETERLAGSINASIDFVWQAFVAFILLSLGWFAIAQIIG